MQSFGGIQLSFRRRNLDDVRRQREGVYLQYTSVTFEPLQILTWIVLQQMIE